MTLTGVKAGQVTGGTITLMVTYDGTTYSIPGISLCNSTSAIACSSLASGPNPISFEFTVPKIPTGTYGVQLVANLVGVAKQGCLKFDVTVQDPSDTSPVFTSWLEATLAGVAQFPVGNNISLSSNYTSRRIGDPIQVGPLGNMPANIAKNNQWGSFINVVGSEDIIDPGFNPAGYVWGLNGNMTVMRILSTQQIHTQTYEGTFYLGYVNNMDQRTLDTDILEGEFILTWTFDYGSDGTVTSSLAGDIYFDRQAVLPTGWRAPISIGRLVRLSLYTNSQGNLIVNGTKKYCLTTELCDFEQTGVAPPSEGLTDKDIGIMVALLVGIPLIAALIGATVLYLRHKRRTEQEEGIFSSARKPEYGNALVIDDIIQESREHGGSGLIPPLERRPGDSDSDYSDEDDNHTRPLSPRSGRSSNRGSRISSSSRRRSRSPSPSDSDLRRSPAAGRRSRSFDDSDSDGGSSEDRD
jgi:hypothetical protein